MTESPISRGHRVAARRTGAFTLIELLVVIAILSILSAILFPVLASARAKARQTVCQSNLKQIGSAIAMYTQDYDGCIPPTAIFYPESSTGMTGDWVAWPTLVNVYLHNQDVFACPSGNTTPFHPDPAYVTGKEARIYVDETNTDDTNRYLRTVNRLSYGRNVIPDVRDTSTDPVHGWFYTDPQGRRWGKEITKFGFAAPGADTPSTTDGINESQVEAPATTIHICDTMAGVRPCPQCDPRTYGESIRTIGAEGRTDRAPYDTPSKVSYRHFGGFDCLFGDGHAGWKRWGTTTACDWSVQDDTCP